MDWNQWHALPPEIRIEYGRRIHVHRMKVRSVVLAEVPSAGAWNRPRIDKTRQRAIERLRASYDVPTADYDLLLCGARLT